MAFIDGLPDAPAFGVAVVVVAALLVTRLSRVVLRRVVRRMAHRAVARPSKWWRTRDEQRRTESTEQFEARRRQRIDAAAHMLNHLFAVVVWIIVAIAVFQMLDLDAAFFLSSAGFIGAGFAIGGQHKVHDYFTGLSVLLEDRYGVGDEIVVSVPNWSEPVRGIVEHVGLVSTRLRDDRGAVHLPHGSLANVRNLSQEPADAVLSVRLPAGATGPSVDEVAATMRSLAGSQHLTDVLFVEDIRSAGPSTDDPNGHRVNFEVRTSRPLQTSERELLVRRTEERIGAPARPTRGDS
jgi:moderate conductance mechanosensitive channel